MCRPLTDVVDEAWMPMRYRSSREAAKTRSAVVVIARTAR